MNSIILIGNLTRDPEVTYTNSGKMVAKFGIAVHGFNKEDESIFVDIVAWNKTAELCDQYLKKGNKAAINGRLCVDTWEDRDTGQRRSRTYVTAINVEFLTPKTGQKQHQAQSQNQEYQPRQKQAPPPPPFPDTPKASPAPLPQLLETDDSFDVSDESIDDIPF